MYSQETTRITLQVLKEELGDAFKPEAADAFKALLDHIHQLLAESSKISPLSSDDLNVIHDDWRIVKQNKNFGANAIMKYILYILLIFLILIDFVII